MAVRDTPPFRADHVGSLLRPPEFLQARATLEDEAIRDVYPEPDAFWDDLVAAYGAELSGVYGLDCRYLVELDDTSLAYINDPAQRSHIERIGGVAEEVWGPQQRI